MDCINGCNWMKYINGSKSIAEINIPGTHDSGTQYVSKNTRQFCCQNLSIEEQLKIGVRYLDIRSYIKGNMEVPQIKHASALCLKSKEDKSENNCLTLSNIIQIAEKFLLENNSETILFQVKNESGDDKKLVKYLENYIQNNDTNNLFWIDDKIPTLSEIRGKIVLIRRFTYNKKESELIKGELGINLSSWDTECSVKALFSTYVKVDDKAYVQDRYNVAGTVKYNLIIQAIKEANAINNKVDNWWKWWKISLTSCIIYNPLSVAKAINKRLMDESLICKGSKLGTFIMDFVDEDLVRKVYLTNKDVDL